MATRNYWDGILDRIQQEKERRLKQIGPRVRGGEIPPFQRVIPPKERSALLTALLEDPDRTTPLAQLAEEIVYEQFARAARRAGQQQVP